MGAAPGWAPPQDGRRPRMGAAPGWAARTGGGGRPPPPVAWPGRRSPVSDPRGRRIGAFVAALIGGYLMHLALDPQSSVGTAVWTFLGGLVLWVAVAAVLLRFYAPGTETFSAHEVAVAPEWRVARFLRLGQDAAPLY